jgi:hypothetical protein
MIFKDFFVFYNTFEENKHDLLYLTDNQRQYLFFRIKLIIQEIKTLSLFKFNEYFLFKIS